MNKDFNNLTQTYLWFLVTEHGFLYNEKQNSFDNGSIKIFVEHHDRRIPSILVWKKSEPKFTSILINWLLMDYIDDNVTDKYLLEDTFKYYAQILHKQASNLFPELDVFLL